MRHSKKQTVLSNRNFRLVFFGALVSELGALLYSFAVSFYILEISGNNAFLQGLYLALCGVATLIFTPVGGILGDRFNKARIMYVCDFLKGGIILLGAVLLLLSRSPGSHISILFGLGIAGNMVSGVFTPAAAALFPHIIEEDSLQQANSFNTIKNSLESILGILLAGILYASVPIQTLFLLVGISFVISGVSEMLIRYEYHPPREPLTFKLAAQEAGEGIQYLKARKSILALVGSMLFINFFFAPVTGNFLPFFVKTELSAASSYLLDRLLTPELWASVFSVCFGISSLLGAALLSARRQKKKCGFSTAIRLCVSAAVMVLLAVCHWLFVDRGISLNGFLIAFSMVSLATGFLISLINIPINTTMMLIVDKDKLSKVNSIISVSSHGIIPLASVLAGMILETLGSTALLAFSSLGFMVTALLLLFNRHIRDI